MLNTAYKDYISMAFANVNIGAHTSDGTGDSLRVAFQKINQNFANIASMGNPGPVQSVNGHSGNVVLTAADIVGVASVGYADGVGYAGNTYTNFVFDNIQSNVYNFVAGNLASSISQTATNLVITGDLLSPINANIAGANAAIASLQSTVGGYSSSISSLSNNLSNQQGLISALQANAATQAGQIAGVSSAIVTANTQLKGYTDTAISTAINTAINNLINSAPGTLDTLGEIAANLATDAGAIGGILNSITNINSNINATNSAIISANTDMKAYVDTANSIQAGQISTLISNTGVIAGELNSLLTNFSNTQNLVSQNTSDIETINTRLEGGNTAIIVSNSAVVSYVNDKVSLLQAGLNGANAAIVTANTTMKGYVDAVTAAWTANAVEQLSQITGANAAIVTANTALKSYVDDNIGSTNSNVASVNSNIGAINSTIASIETNLNGYSDLFGYITSNINQINSNVTATNAAIVTANSAMQLYVVDYVDQQIIAVGNYGNINVAAYLPTHTGNVAGQNFITSQGIFWSNGAPFTSANLTHDLPLYSGNVSAKTLLVTGDSTTGFYPIYSGLQSGYFIIPNLLGQFSANANSYAQLNITNINSGSEATTDYVATANNGTDSSFYVDVGIAGSNYDGTHPANNLGTAIFPNDAYIYTQGNNPSDTGGNLLVGAVTPGKGIFFIAGGHDQANIAVAIHNPNTAPISSGTGTLVVKGGVGIGGNINAGLFNTSLHNIKGNLLLGQGNVIASADTVLTINLNTDTPIASANNTVHLSGASGHSTFLGIDSFGTGFVSGINLRTSRGNSGSPSASQAGDILGIVVSRGYGSTGYSAVTGSGSQVSFSAAENYTDTAQGSYINLRPVPIGSNVATTAVNISATTTTIAASTASTSFLNGALVVGGGAGINGNLNVLANVGAGNISAGGSITSTNNVTAANYFFANGTNILSTISKPSRTILTATTATLAAGASANVLLGGYKGYYLYSIQVNNAAWVTLYTSNSSATADYSRSISTDPTPGSGVIAEAITSGAATQYFTPGVIGYNAESPATAIIPMKVYNNGGSSAAITVQLTLVQTEQ